LPHRLLSHLALLITLVQAGGIGPAEREHSEALRLLGESDGRGAEAAARRALSKSSHFIPEREIEVAPEKGVLFEDMIEEARTAYRERRGRYFKALGTALAAQERWAEARKALRRSANLIPSAETLMAMASHPDLSMAQRVELLVDAYFAPGADPPAIEEALLESGAFADRDVLQAVFDEERFTRELATEFPEIEAVVAPLPEIRVAATSGTFVSSEFLSAGMTVVLYFPVVGCNRCSEELDAIGRALVEWGREGNEFVVAAFVGERELTSTRRIVRLLGMGIEVGRVDRLPAGIEPSEEGEIRIVARGGLMQMRISLGETPSGNEIRRQMEAALRLLGAPKDESTATRRESTGARPVQTGQDRKAFSALVDRAAALEVGPVPIPDLYRQIDLSLRNVLREATSEAQAVDALEKLARLRGAASAKARALLALDRGLPGKLLTAVKQIAPDVDVQARTDQGVYYLDVTELGGYKAILLQRSFFGDLMLRNFDFILRLDEGKPSVVWVGPEPEEPTGTRAIPAGAVFFFEGEGCRGLRLIGEEGPLYKGCPARLEGEEIIEVKEVLLDPVPSPVAPLFYRRGKIEDSRLVAPESSLERGIRLFREGSYRQALSAFQDASKNIDSVAPYDETDLRYNVARCYEALGQRPKALELMETVGDAAYQSVVDERIGELEVATRR
jgi:tetratricopeptide (TPR) repeat protein